MRMVLGTKRIPDVTQTGGGLTPDPSSPDGSPELLKEGSAEVEETIKETAGLLDAILAWRPNGVPLEQIEGARKFADSDPEKVEDVRLIERLLAKYRKSNTPPGGKEADNI